jgi:hypothetical protein
MAWVTYEHATLPDLEIWVVDDSDDEAVTSHPGLQVGRQFKEGEVVARNVDDTGLRILEAIPEGYTAVE